MLYLNYGNFLESKVMKKIYYFLLALLSLSISSYARADDCTSGPAWTFEIENNTGFSMMTVQPTDTNHHKTDKTGFSVLESPIAKFSTGKGTLHYCCGSQHWSRVNTVIYQFSDPQKNQCAVSFAVSCTPEATDPSKAPHVSVTPNVVCTKGTITTEFRGGGTSAASEPIKFTFTSQ
jgi:hypothetical protein